MCMSVSVCKYFHMFAYRPHSQSTEEGISSFGGRIRGGKEMPDMGARN